jgi:hypothetical protein
MSRSTSGSHHAAVLAAERKSKVMTSASGNGGCGCNQPDQQRLQLLPGKFLGTEWKDIVDKVLMEDAVTHARLLLDDDAFEAPDEIEVRMPLAVYFRFKVEGRSLTGDGGVSCVCTTTPDGVVCKCVGQCNFDACCDADAGTPPIA